jgi:hypothetical protein
MVSGTKFTCCNLKREKTSKKEYILHRMVLSWWTFSETEVLLFFLNYFEHILLVNSQNDNSSFMKMNRNSLEKTTPSDYPWCRAGTFLVYFLDEISTGLDSSAAYDIVSTFRTYARIKQFTCLFSLLQPSPEVFDLFDR